MNMPANRKGIRDAKAARAEKRKKGPAVPAVVKRPASAARGPAVPAGVKRPASADVPPEALEVKTPCENTIKKLHKALGSFVSFDSGPRDGKTKVKRLFQRGKVMYQLVAADKTTLGQVSAYSYGYQGSLDLATCMASMYDKGGSQEPCIF